MRLNCAVAIEMPAPQLVSASRYRERFDREARRFPSCHLGHIRASCAVGDPSGTASMPSVEE
jgi:hypothetical protein